MSRSNIYISMAAVCFILGIMLSLQYKANYTNDLWPDQESEQTVQTERLRQQNDELISEIASLQEKLSQTNEKELISEVNKMLDKATICGGLSGVTGPGVTIQFYYIAAADSIYSPTLEMQAKDLLIIINELRSAGAEAISINNHRLLATSPIYYRDNSITVNQYDVSAPYEIRAIGNPDVLYSSLRLKGGEVDNLILLGYQVEIEKKKVVDIPAFTRRVSLPTAMLADSLAAKMN